MLAGNKQSGGSRMRRSYRHKKHGSRYHRNRTHRHKRHGSRSHRNRTHSHKKHGRSRKKKSKGLFGFLFS